MFVLAWKEKKHGKIILWPIYYPSVVHIGSAYTTIFCDVALQTHDELRCFYWLVLSNTVKESASRRSWDHAASLCRWDGRWVENSGNYSISLDKFIRTTVTMKNWWPKSTERLRTRRHLQIEYSGYSVSMESSSEMIIEIFDEEWWSHRWK